MNDGTFRDIAHPITNEFREKLEKAVLEKYKQESRRDGRRPSKNDDEFF